MHARTILKEVDVEYLACSVGAVTATELARLSGGQLSHDQITRALAGPARGARELWARVKPLVRAAEAEVAGQGVLLIDGTILPSPTATRVNWWAGTLTTRSTGSSRGSTC